MLTKKELLEYLQRALVVEEKSVDIYLKHLDSSVFWLGFPDKKVAEIQKRLKELANHSRRHTDLITGLIAKVKGEDRDAF